jgi:hypothetical protein
MVATTFCNLHRRCCCWSGGWCAAAGVFGCSSVRKVPQCVSLRPCCTIIHFERAVVSLLPLLLALQLLFSIALACNRSFHCTALDNYAVDWPACAVVRIHSPVCLSCLSLVLPYVRPCTLLCHTHVRMESERHNGDAHQRLTTKRAYDSRRQLLRRGQLSRGGLLCVAGAGACSEYAKDGHRGCYKAEQILPLRLILTLLLLAAGDSALLMRETMPMTSMWRRKSRQCRCDPSTANNL